MGEGKRSNVEKVRERLVIQGFSEGTKIEVVLIEKGRKTTVYKGEVGKR